MLFLFRTAILCTQLVGHKASKDPLDEEPRWLADGQIDMNQAIMILKNRFGTVLQSLFTLYHMSLGDDLSFGIRLSAESEPIMWVVLVAFSLFMTFAVLNLITGVIVECSFSASAKEKAEHEERTKKAEIQLVEVGICHEIFKLADTDNSGFLTPEQYRSAFQNKVVKEKILALGLDLRHAEELYDMIDVNDDGEISLRELVQGFLILRRGAQGDTVSAMHRDVLRCHDLVHRDVLALQAQAEQHQIQMTEMLAMQKQQQQQIADLMTMVGATTG